MNIHWKDWCWSWSSNTLATWYEELTHWKRPWCWERLKSGEGNDRRWNGWMASPTQWTWVWASSGRWWRTGKLGMLQSMVSQTVGHDWAIEQQQLNFSTEIREKTLAFQHHPKFLLCQIFHFAVIVQYKHQASASLIKCWQSLQRPYVETDLQNQQGKKTGIPQSKRRERKQPVLTFLMSQSKIFTFENSGL